MKLKDANIAKTPSELRSRLHEHMNLRYPTYRAGWSGACDSFLSSSFNTGEMIRFVCDDGFLSVYGAIKTGRHWLTLTSGALLTGTEIKALMRLGNYSGFIAL